MFAHQPRLAPVPSVCVPAAVPQRGAGAPQSGVARHHLRASGPRSAIGFAQQFAAWAALHDAGTPQLVESATRAEIQRGRFGGAGVCERFNPREQPVNGRVVGPLRRIIRDGCAIRTSRAIGFVGGVSERCHRARCSQPQTP